MCKCIDREIQSRQQEDNTEIQGAKKDIRLYINIIHTYICYLCMILLQFTLYTVAGYSFPLCKWFTGFL